ncbi:hypothetical protein PNU26_06680 [Streptococcus salivarius]|uniref:Uncharacterized protein n=1 Tax=Streptococcus salivarius TaxID=1304 RepID=A0AAW6D7A4_STRSL|nr:hypothetical protein [Streptococcus salivarius]MDB8614080.1 hypothetical protein [Streptococcus salivarius]
MEHEVMSSRQLVMNHLMTIMGIETIEGNLLVADLEKEGLLQFDDFGNVGLLVLEGQS